MTSHSTSHSTSYSKGHQAMRKPMPQIESGWGIVSALCAHASVALALGCRAFAPRLALATDHALPRVLIAVMILMTTCSFLALYLSTWKAIIAGRVGLILIYVVLIIGLIGLNNSAIRAVYLP